MQTTLEKALAEFPEVKEVFSKIGTAEVATDPMPPNVADTYRDAKAANRNGRTRRAPRPTWSLRSRSASQDVPGNNYEFTQPIQMRFNELISGVRSDVGVKIFGDDLDTLLKVAGQVQSVMQAIPGAADVKTEQVSGLPVMTVKLNRPALSRYGLSAADVQGIVEIAVGGQERWHRF